VNKLKVLLFLATALFLYFCWGGESASDTVQSGLFGPASGSAEEQKSKAGIR
jgi:hypothetical protein